MLLIRSEPLGRVKYYAIRVEFQFRGSPHIHSFLAISNASTLSEKLLDYYVDFLDSVVCGKLPSEQEDSHLYDLVKTFQMHCHSKASRKCKNMTCRFKFGRFFTEKKKIVAKPVQSALSQVEKFKILNKRSNILCKVKKSIDTHLDPSSKKFSNDKTIQEILLNMEVTEVYYYGAL